MRPVALALLVVGTVLGWGLVTNTLAGWLDLAGLPARARSGSAARTGAWAYANLGVLRRASSSASSAPSPLRALGRAAAGAADRVTRRGWLVVVDLQRVFGDPDSPWATPRFAEVRPRVRALVDAFGDRVVFTRFVAPDEPAGAWAAYYEQFPFALQPPDAPLYAAGRGARAAPRSSTRPPSASGAPSWRPSSATARSPSPAWPPTAA